jgi:hypothetical protein
MLSLSCCAAGVSLRKFLPIPTNSRVFLGSVFNENFELYPLNSRSQLLLPEGATFIVKRHKGAETS